MSDSVLRTKSKEFARNIVFLCRNMKQNGVEGALINQHLRCGTSVGANVHEAQYAQGTKDFISKLRSKKQVKRVIGLSSYTGQIISMSKLSKRYPPNALL